MVSERELQRREKISKNHPRFWLGKKRSLEDREKMSKAKIEKYKGTGNPFFGKKHSEETKKKLSEAMKGRKAPNPFPKGNIPWNKGIKGHLSGENHYNWQGGITPKNAKIRNSFEMKQWRRMIFERDDYTCQLCKKRGTTLHADHIKPFAYFPELRFELSNGRTLCVDCHKKTDTFLSKAKRPLG